MGSDRRDVHRLRRDVLALICLGISACGRGTQRRCGGPSRFVVGRSSWSGCSTIAKGEVKRDERPQFSSVELSRLTQNIAPDVHARSINKSIDEGARPDPPRNRRSRRD